MMKPINKNIGFSILELLIAMGIGVFILNGVIRVVLNSKSVFQEQKNVEFIQENTRFALDLMNSEVRMAGYFGCADETSNYANTMKDDLGGLIDFLGIQGFEGRVNTNDFPDSFKGLALAGTDAIIVRRSDHNNEIYVKEQNPTQKLFNIWGSHEFDDGTPIMVVDNNCEHAGLFTLSNFDNKSLIGHKQTTDSCTDSVKGNFSCGDCISGSCTNSLNFSPYRPGAKLMEYLASAYFIGDSAINPGIPALKRQTLSVENGRLTTNIEELASGIEDMEIIYGIDLNGDKKVNEYRMADEMDVNNDGTIDAEDWIRVLAVKADLVLRSDTQVLENAEQQDLNGTVYNDRFLRKVVSASLQIRNKEY